MRDRIISITESEYISLKELEDDYKYIAEDHKNLKERINKAIRHLRSNEWYECTHCDGDYDFDEKVFTRDFNDTTNKLLKILEGGSNE